MWEVKCCGLKRLNKTLENMWKKLKHTLRVCLVGNVKKWKNGKWWEDRKYIIFSHFCLLGMKKMKEWKKISLNKFSHIILLKNDAQLK